MKFVLSHRTAAFATHIPQIRRALITSKRVAIPEPLKPDICEAQLDTLRKKLQINERICCSAFTEEHKRRSLRYFTKRPTVSADTEAFVHLGIGLYIPCPELIFLQMASELEIIELIRFGFDLCGTYIPGHGDTEAEYWVEPLTTAAKLLKFCLHHPDATGSTKALRASKQIIDRCASPAESNLAMRLCLPQRFGGFGAPKPVANIRFNAKTNERIPDFLWKQYGIEVEYDSKEYHDNATRDAIRRNELQPYLRILTVTPGIVASPHEFEKFGKLFFKMAKRQFRLTSHDFKRRQLELHDIIQSPEWYKRMPTGSYVLTLKEENRVPSTRQHKSESQDSC